MLFRSPRRSPWESIANDRPVGCVGRVSWLFGRASRCGNLLEIPEWSAVGPFLISACSGPPHPPHIVPVVSSHGIRQQALPCGCVGNDPAVDPTGPNATAHGDALELSPWPECGVGRAFRTDRTSLRGLPSERRIPFERGFSERSTRLAAKSEGDHGSSRSR